ncbi:hypothetical protein [Streptococcus infantis]|uniref:hypothetical protein n=1 Tax=Streptococcus infantis TaxID=68892 RepID=UPI0039C06A7B
MSDLISQIFEILPEKAKWAISIITVLGVALAFGFIIYTIWKYARAVDKESRVFDLSKQNQQLLEENRQIRYFSTLLKTNFELLDEIIPTLEIQISRIQDVWYSNNQEAKKKCVDEVYDVIIDAVQRYIDVLTSEFNSENKCRISVWGLSNKEGSEDKLNIIARSATFLRSSNRELDINNSIAGRAFRKGTKQLSKHLESDPDWEKYLLDSRYKSISAFPIQGEKVVTIDYKNVPTEVEERLSELIVNGLDNIYSRISKIRIFLNVIEGELNDGEE